jgi:hypothetical protein
VPGAQVQQRVLPGLLFEVQSPPTRSYATEDILEFRSSSHFARTLQARESGCTRSKNNLHILLTYRCRTLGLARRGDVVLAVTPPVPLTQPQHDVSTSEPCRRGLVRRHLGDELSSVGRGVVLQGSRHSGHHRASAVSTAPVIPFGLSRTASTSLTARACGTGAGTVIGSICPVTLALSVTRRPRRNRRSWCVSAVGLVRRKESALEPAGLAVCFGSVRSHGAVRCSGGACVVVGAPALAAPSTPTPGVPSRSRRWTDKPWTSREPRARSDFGMGPSK